MKRSRITTLGLMGVIAIVGVLLAALRHPTPLMASLAWTGVLTLLIGAALVAVLDHRRTYWVGFAVVGLTFAAFAGAHMTLDLQENGLLTTHLLAHLFFYLHAGEPGLYFERVFILTDFGLFHRTGQALATMIHAIVGGLIAIPLRRRLLAVPVPTRPDRLSDPLPFATDMMVES